MIIVIKPGLSTTVQDAGREGFHHLGIPPSGAIDPYAMQMANLLVGNEPNAAVLEMTLLGPTLLFEKDALVAIAGATFAPMIENQPVPLHTVLHIRAGEQLCCPRALQGCNAYLAVAGGIDVPVVLGSRSTYLMGALGGYKGRRLAAGDRLSILPVVEERGALEGKTVAPSLLPVMKNAVTLRLMMGLQADLVTWTSLDNFFADSWLISSESDRTGFRLRGGRPLAFTPRRMPFGAGLDPSNIVDACYPIGSVQVPGGQEPIVLLRDGVSCGGYAMLGAVISPDLPALGQLQPNQQVRFVPVMLKDALIARRQWQQRLAHLTAVLR